MTIDDLLRETAPDHAHARRHTDRRRPDVLARATSAPARRTRRPLRLSVAGVALAAVGVGGIAYATGAPGWIGESVDLFGEQAGVPAAQRPTMTQVVDLELPDGSRFAAWRGLSDAMWCTAYVDRWDGRGHGTGGTSCSDAGDEAYDLNRVQIVWAEAADGSTYFPVLFGHLPEGVSTARITGELAATGREVDLSVPVDPATDTFATALPGTVDHPWGRPAATSAERRESGIVVDLVDADGTVVATVDDLVY